MADIKTYYTNKRDQNKSAEKQSLLVYETPSMSHDMAFRHGKKMIKIQNLCLTKAKKSYLIT